MREQNIEKIRAACIGANTEIVDREFHAMHGDGHYCVHHPDDPAHSERCYELPADFIRLADVLLAKPHEHFQLPWETDTNRKIRDIVVAEIVDTWNLRKDDLTEQSDDTISFIASLL